jgi:hypothetical protein
VYDRATPSFVTFGRTGNIVEINGLKHQISDSRGRPDVERVETRVQHGNCGEMQVASLAGVDWGIDIRMKLGIRRKYDSITA